MDYRPLLRALVNAELELRSAQFELAFTQGSNYGGELMAQLTRAERDVQSVRYSVENDVRGRERR